MSAEALEEKQETDNQQDEQQAEYQAQQAAKVAARVRVVLDAMGQSEDGSLQLENLLPLDCLMNGIEHDTPFENLPPESQQKVSQLDGVLVSQFEPVLRNLADKSPVQFEKMETAATKLTAIRAVEKIIQSGLSQIGRARLGNGFHYQRLELPNKGLTSADSAAKYRELKYVDLSSNQLRDVVAINKLSNLVYLNVQANTISSVSALGPLPELQLLALDQNSISALDFPTLPKLAILTASKNKLTKLSDEVNSALPSLTSLDVSFNAIDVLSARSCNRFAGLKSLNLASNKIASLDGLQHCSLLQSLDLSRNRVRSFKELKYVEKLSKLTTLSLAENPLSLAAPLEADRPAPKAPKVKSKPIKKEGDEEEDDGEAEPEPEPEEELEAENELGDNLGDEETLTEVLLMLSALTAFTKFNGTRITAEARKTAKEVEQQRKEEAEEKKKAEEEEKAERAREEAAEKARIEHEMEEAEKLKAEEAAAAADAAAALDSTRAEDAPEVEPNSDAPKAENEESAEVAGTEGDEAENDV